MKVRSPLPQLQTWTFAENQSWLPSGLVGNDRFEVSRRLRWLLTGHWHGVFGPIAEGNEATHNVFVERVSADTKGNYSYVLMSSFVQAIEDQSLNVQSLNAKLSDFDKFVRDQDQSKAKPTVAEFAEGVMQFLRERAEWQNMSSVLTQVASDSAIDLLQFLDDAMRGVVTIASKLSESTQTARRQLTSSNNNNAASTLLSDRIFSYRQLISNGVSTSSTTTNAAESFVGALCGNDVKVAVRAFSDLLRFNDNIAIWKRTGDEIAFWLTLNGVIDATDIRFALARHCWRQHASMLDTRASNSSLMLARCESLKQLYGSLIQSSFAMQGAARRVQMEYEGERSHFGTVCSDDLPRMLTTAKPKESINGHDLFEQLDRCRELIDRLRIGALELHCSLIDGRFNDALAAELSVLMNVTLIKCRSVLTDQAMTRFARRCIWSSVDGRQRSEHYRIGVFHQKCPALLAYFIEKNRELLKQDFSDGNTLFIIAIKSEQPVCWHYFISRIKY